ncbi:NUDIX hydrolase [Roseivivax isoporae]|uniref:NUDIX hydrolase n=1 Tax=Roseivivax isoporae LMG 25204 TaxID=1449351 RepID=X7F469_9RHOB|nr:NUDIX hydrolase [Roseivivax isoporae]ETX27717.1 NUDIX hydrolase [Roseivivax isoporae LMG 25204]
MIRTLWTNFILPILRRPSRYQVAALCWRPARDDVEILLVTSLETRRWVLPKGWPKSGFDGLGTALEEAWEEAGVRAGATEPRPVGRYRYDKRMRGGLPVPTDVDVFAIEIATLLDDYPEAGRRDRRWMSPAEAAAAVTEPDLKELLDGVGPRLRTPAHA